MNQSSDHRSLPSRVQPAEGSLALFDRHLSVVIGGMERRFHYVWLRDNSWAEPDRVALSGERKLFTAEIDENTTPVSASYDTTHGLTVLWNDGQACVYSPGWLDRHDYSDSARAARRFTPTLWDEQAQLPPRFTHEEVLGSTEGQLAYLDAVRACGAAIVSGVPSVDGEAERFAETIGHVREIAFERVHNVRTDPAGYSVAHTSGELKPHTDIPSYAWPPSIQLLHFLTNQADGGESTLTDGWAAADELRRTLPQLFDVLVRTPVPFQVFSDQEDTATEAPIISLAPGGEVQMIRFSNHTVQPLSLPFDEVERFYEAYRALGRIIDSGRYRATFKCHDGDLITVHGHRVMHGRLPFKPATGARHLQDVYMEFDDLTARARVLRGGHQPIPAQDPSPAHR